MMTIEVQGLENEIKLLTKRLDDVPKMVHAVMKNGAEVIAREAKSNAPGKITIEVVEHGYLDFDVEATQFFAPYVEFGTGDVSKGGHVFQHPFFVTAPSWLKVYAMQFYVNGKGRMYPHPFLFPAYFKYRDQIVKDIKAQLNKPIGFKNP